MSFQLRSNETRLAGLWVLAGSDPKMTVSERWILREHVTY